MKGDQSKDGSNELAPGENPAGVSYQCLTRHRRRDGDRRIQRQCAALARLARARAAVSGNESGQLDTRRGRHMT